MRLKLYQLTAVRKFFELWGAWQRNAVQICWGITFGCLLVFAVYRFIPGLPEVRNFDDLVLSLGMFGLVITAVVVGKLRIGLLIGLCTVVLFFCSNMLQFQSQMEIALRLAFSISAGMAVAIVGALVTIVRDYLRILNARNAEKKQSRQHMIGRLLDLREAKAKAEADKLKKNFWLDLGWMEDHLIVTIAAILLIIIAMDQALVRWIDPTGLAYRSPGYGETNGGQGRAAVVFTLIMVGLAAQALFGFLARTVGRGFIAFVAALVIGFIPRALKVGYYGFDTDTLSSDIVFSKATLLLMTTTVGVALRYVTEAYDRQRGIAHNDPATIQNAIEELERHLAPTTKVVSVLVVDVVGSTAMKSGQDPLVAEWSFREYVKTISETVLEYDGSITNLAGDGLIAAFDDPESALIAAKSILNGVERFNRKVNRLPVPFNVRIGLHTGEVSGDLSEVQYSRLIDVAAHIEAVTPQNAICISEPFAEQLGNSKIWPAHAEVDGFAVYVV